MTLIRNIYKTLPLLFVFALNASAISTTPTSIPQPLENRADGYVSTIEVSEDGDGGRVSLKDGSVFYTKKDKIINLLAEAAQNERLVNIFYSKQQITRVIVFY